MNAALAAILILAALTPGVALWIHCITTHRRWPVVLFFASMWAILADVFQTHVPLAADTALAYSFVGMFTYALATAAITIFLTS